MVELSDITLVESHGNYKMTCEIMDSDGPPDWMLRSEAIVSVGSLAFNYLLHFWHDGMVKIMETNHPPVMSVPDVDIRALSEWCDINGWKKPCLYQNLISDPNGFQFWMFIYRSGLVESEELKKYEDEEFRRLTQALEED